MKKRMLLALLLGCLFLLTACQSFKQDELSTADIALVDGQGRTVVSYGMSKETVEKTLGTGTPAEDMNLVSYDAARISVWYRDDKAVGFICNGEGYSTPRGITIGSRAHEVRQCYGVTSLNTLEDGITTGTTYYYRYDTQTKRSLDTEKPLYSLDLTRQICFSTLQDEDNTVKGFSAVDALMGFFMQ